MQEEHTYELPNLKEAVEGNSQYEIPSKFTPASVSTLTTPGQDKSKLKKPVCSLLCMCALVGFILVGSASFTSLALTVWNSSQVNHQSAKLEMEHMITQLQKSLFELEISVNGSISEYEGRITQLQNSLSGLEFSVNGSISEYERRINQVQISIDTSVNVNITELEERVMQLQNSIFGLETSVNGSISEYERRINQLQISVNNLNELQASVSGQIDILLRLNPADSCSCVLQLNPSSPSGHYWIRSSNGSSVRVYCDMTRSCGGVTGGWMRVADLDMRDSSSQCPSGLRQGDSCTSERTCEIGTNSPSGKCSSNSYTSHGLNYSHVCGMIRAYQFRTVDAFRGNNRGMSANINSNYVDGVSLTHGVPPLRQHIWTFAAYYSGKLLIIH